MSLICTFCICKMCKFILNDSRDIVSYVSHQGIYYSNDMSNIPDNLHKKWYVLYDETKIYDACDDSRFIAFIRGLEEICFFGSDKISDRNEKYSAFFGIIKDINKRVFICTVGNKYINVSL